MFDSNIENQSICIVNKRSLRLILNILNIAPTESKQCKQRLYSITAPN